MDNLFERFQATTTVQALQLHILCMNKTFDPKADLSTGI